MTHVLHRALPFVIGLVLGIACTAIVRGVLPRHRRAFENNSWSRCKWKKKMSSRQSHGFVREGSTAIDVIEINRSGQIDHVPFMLSESYSTRLTLEEQALYFRALQEGGRSSPGFVVSYVLPKAIDGQPVTSDAVLFDIPRPGFWFDEPHGTQKLDCNAMIRVDLGSSGNVSKVEPVNGHAEACPHIDDILGAARQISFRPAMRNGVPITQRLSIIYRLD
jgi:hypothetical protein